MSSSDSSYDKFTNLPRRTNSNLDIENRVPVHVVWEITLSCNLKCIHCGSRAGRPRPNELNTNECLDVVRQLHKLGTREISLIGGEAYLRPDWLIIVSEISKLDMLCLLQTGGRALTIKKIVEAKKAGIASIGVSIDGLQDTHDRLRGHNGSFNQAIRVIKDVVNEGMFATVNTQINAMSVNELPQILDKLISLDVKVWQLQLTVAMGNAVENEHLLIQPYEIPEIHSMLYELFVKARSHGIKLDPGNNIGYFGRFEHHWRSATNDHSHWQGCTAGSTTLGIESDGTIKGCPSLPRNPYSGGNIRDLSIENMLSSNGKIKNQKKRTSQDLSGFCKTCYYAEVCQAGCTWTSHVLFGRSGDNPYCDYRATNLARNGLRERIVKVEDAPGLPFDHGKFELIIEDEAGHVIGVNDSRYHDAKSTCENSIRDGLILCANCNQYVYLGDVICPHCETNMSPASPQSSFQNLDEQELASEMRHIFADIKSRSEIIEKISSK